MGRIAPLTPEEKLKYSKTQKQVRAVQREAKEKKAVSASGNDPASAGSGAGNGGGGAAGGPAGGGGHGGVPPVGAVGGGNVGDGTKARAGRKISKIEKPLEVIVDSGKFFNGLPAFSRLLFRAGNNLLKIFNLLPFPFMFEIEDMTQEESELFAQAVKPALEIALPSAGKKHPMKMMGAAFIVGILGKLKAKMKPGAKPLGKVIDIKGEERHG